MACWSSIAEHVKAPHQVRLPQVMGQRLRSDGLALLLLADKGQASAAIWRAPASQAPGALGLKPIVWCSIT